MDSQIEVLTRQADAGDAHAQYVLAGKFATGQCGPANDLRALAWYCQAAQRGHADALYQTGLALLLGDGVLHDPQLAIALITAAAERDSPAACLFLAHATRHGAHGLACDSARADAWAERARIPAGATPAPLGPAADALVERLRALRQRVHCA